MSSGLVGKYLVARRRKDSAVVYKAERVCPESGYIGTVWFRSINDVDVVSESGVQCALNDSSESVQSGETLVFNSIEELLKAYPDDDVVLGMIVGGARTVVCWEIHGLLG